MRRGFGSARVELTVVTATWRTSIIPSGGSVVLPVEMAVRTEVGVDEGDDLDVEPILLVDV